MPSVAQAKQHAADGNADADDNAGNDEGAGVVEAEHRQHREHGDEPGECLQQQQWPRTDRDAFEERVPRDDHDGDDVGHGERHVDQQWRPRGEGEKGQGERQRLSQGQLRRQQRHKPPHPGEPAPAVGSVNAADDDGSEDDEGPAQQRHRHDARGRVGMAIHQRG